MLAFPLLFSLPLSSCASNTCSGAGTAPNTESCTKEGDDLELLQRSHTVESKPNNTEERKDPHYIEGDACVDETRSFRCDHSWHDSRCADDTTGRLCSDPEWQVCWSKHCRGQCGCQIFLYSDDVKMAGLRRSIDCPIGYLLKTCEGEPFWDDTEVFKEGNVCSVVSPGGNRIKAKAVCSKRTDKQPPAALFHRHAF